MKIVECVPNFSEGRDLQVIQRITQAIEAVEGVKLLDVDPGRATHRTVVTFVGPPAAVLDAAVAAGRQAAELIDMTRHKGEHPRFGAMDVCPLVPVAGLTMEETVGHARELARRLAGRASPAGATLHQRFGLALSPVVHGHTVTGVQDVPGHARAHDPGPDKTYLLIHHVTPALSDCC